MRTQVLLWATLPLMSSVQTALADLPQRGACKHTETFLGAAITTSISWSGEAATIEMRNATIDGSVVGLRPHDEEFKLSILYEDPITGPSEMTIFGFTRDGETRYRRAIVGYDILQDGKRVVSHVAGFEDITCSVLE